MELNLIDQSKEPAPIPLNAHHPFLNKRITEDFSSRQYASGSCFFQGFSSQLRVVCLSINSPIRFQNEDKRSELPENGPADSEPSELAEKSEQTEAVNFRSVDGKMGDYGNGKTRSSVLCSVSMEAVSSLKMGGTEFICGEEGLHVDYIDQTSVGRILSTEDDNISEKVRISDSENSVSNVFDLLPEPEVQVLWEDYPILSDSESEPGTLSNGSPKINQSSIENKADVTVEEHKRLESPSDLTQEEEKFVKSSQNSTETNWQNPSKLNFDHHYELNYLPDHQDIIQQLEVELRNTRTGGLPTIFEEETETMEEIDEKCKYEERMGEIQMPYRTYVEKMWKLDILNNQSMHAIGLLQLKYPMQSVSVQNSFVLSSKSPDLLHKPRLWSGKARRLTADPRLEFLGYLRRDMELVYVGQACLSWEILKWQLQKALELQQHDSQSIRQYHQVASEFQLFQVLLKRFMEDERSPSLRVENYVQNRCVFRSLLQVPPIKDDGLNEWENEGGFSSEVLAEIMEKSVRVFNEFLLADKNDGKTKLRSSRKDQTELQNSGNSQHLLVNIKAHFPKVERKLKELLRSSNSCSAEKLENEEEAGLNYALILLIAQVDLKLISRVLRMSKLTVDQLSWCSQKLHQITFVNRKVQLKPSFLPFPF